MKNSGLKKVEYFVYMIKIGSPNRQMHKRHAVCVCICFTIILNGVWNKITMTGLLFNWIKLLLTALSWSSLKSVDLDQYCRNSPLIFSFNPRCNEQYGTAKNSHIQEIMKLLYNKQIFYHCQLWLLNPSF